MGRVKETGWDFNDDSYKDEDVYINSIEDEKQDALTEYNQVSKRINEIREKRTHFANKLKVCNDEDDIIECKYQMMKLREELSPLISRQKILAFALKTEQQKKERAFREENERKKFEEECKNQEEKIYKKLYVLLSDMQLNLLKKIFKIQQDSRESIMKDMFNNYSMAVIIIITSLFEILSFSEVERIATNIEKYDESFWKVVYKYENNDIIFNKLSSLPDIKKTEKEADAEVDIFEGAYPIFTFSCEDDEDYDSRYEKVHEMFIEFNHFFSLP